MYYTSEGGKNEVLIISPEYSMRMYYMSFLSIFTILFALYYKSYDVAVLITAILFTSLNYWKHPIYGYRRILDMSVVITALVYLLYKSFKNNYQVPFIILVVTSVICYLNAWFYKIDTNEDMSSIWHCALHIFGHMACITLICGL